MNKSLKRKQIGFRKKESKERGNTCEKRKPNKKSGEELTFFHETLILIVSLLHGNLFFILGEKLVEMINDFSFSKASQLLFMFCVFFRIFQTHLLAAIKYTNKWVFKPLDFVLVFGTSLFEYLLFSNDTIHNNQSNWYYGLLFFFCIFGIIGYALSYFRTKRSFPAHERRKELLLQSANIICVLLVGVINAVCYFFFQRSNTFLVISNLSSSLILIFNVFLSLSLSKDQLRNVIKV